MEQTVAQTGDRVSSGTRNRAIVVGAGFGGIASALRLAAKGYRVTLIDPAASCLASARRSSKKTALGMTPARR